MRSPASMSWAIRRRRSFMPTRRNPRARVASKFSGEPVRIQVFGAGAICRRLYARLATARARRHSRMGLRPGSGDRDVLDVGLGAALAFDPLQPPVDQRPDELEHLAD